MRQIKINSPKYGEHTVFLDEKDFDEVNKFNWYLVRYWNTFYAQTHIKRNKKQTTICMHRMILKDVAVIDHKDSNGLNNTRSNLRSSTTSQNAANQRKHKNTSSSYKGVSFVKTRNKYIAQICLNGKSINLGRFKKETDAARAYNEAAIKYFGEFAKLNKVD